MSGQWYVMGRDEIRGPYSKEHLQRLIEAGRLKPTMQVRQGSAGPWRLADKVPGLFTPDSKPAAPPAPNPFPRPLILCLLIGGAVVGTSVVTAVVCLSLLGSSRVSPEKRPAPSAPVIAAVETGPKPVEEQNDSSPADEPGDDDLQGLQTKAEVVSDLPATPVEKSAPTTVAEETEPANVAASAPPVVVLDPKPIIPPVPAEKTPIEDSKIVDFNKSVRFESKAKDAYARYLAFSQSFAFTDEQRGRVENELAEWKDRADKDLYRLGTEWVALEKVQAAEKEADKLIERAFALIRTGSYKECVDFLEDASRVNPNGTRADYTLGLLNSLPIGFKAPAIAEKHFRTVLQRSPNNAAALNSLAISQLKQREFGVALTNFARSSELTPNCQEVAHNLGRAVMLVEQGRLPIEPGQLRRYTDLYSQLIADERAKPYEERIGWLHMLPVFPADERKDDQPQQPQNPDLVAAFRGSGFVVAPQMIATNRHVVHEADGRGVVDAVGIVDPDDPAHKRELKGTVVAVSDTIDLALVKFFGLKLPPLEVVSLPAKQAEEVMILGFPRSDLFGTTIKSTRGVISALPDANRAVFPDYYLFDAISDHGNSGGPIIDRSGKVIAVLTAGLGLQARMMLDLEAEFTAGVPGNQLDAFANQHIAELKTQTPVVREVAGNEWADIVAQATPSVVHLTCYYKAGLAGLNLAGDGRKGSSGAWEDRTCPFCSGNSRVACPGKGCISGRISVPYYVDEVLGSGNLRQVIRHKKIRKENCSTCGGVGTLDCRGCIDGVDSFLRR